MSAPEDREKTARIERVKLRQSDRRLILPESVVVGYGYEGCPRCEGSGVEYTLRDEQPCYACDGSGLLRQWGSRT